MRFLVFQLAICMLCCLGVVSSANDNQNRKPKKYRLFNDPSEEGKKRIKKPAILKAFEKKNQWNFGNKKNGQTKEDFKIKKVKFQENNNQEQSDENLIKENKKKTQKAKAKEIEALKRKVSSKPTLLKINKKLKDARKRQKKNKPKGLETSASNIFRQSKKSIKLQHMQNRANKMFG